MNWLARLSLLFGLNAVPVVGVARAGWTNATALVLYWCETVILVLLVALRIHLHRRWTNKRGHYCEVLVKTTRGSSSKTQTTIGYFGTSFIIVALLFAIIQAVFLSAILYKAQLWDTISFAQLKQGIAATAVLNRHHLRRCRKLVVWTSASNTLHFCRFEALHGCDGAIASV